NNKELVTDDNEELVTNNNKKLVTNDNKDELIEELQTDIDILNLKM
ncbi:36894_t:CDS:1, partial [Racocetra persica]